MAENKNDFNETVASLFKGMDSFLSAKASHLSYYLRPIRKM